MPPTPVHDIPIVTTVLSVPFALEIYRRWRRCPERLHLLPIWAGYRISVRPTEPAPRGRAARVTDDRATSEMSVTVA